MVLVGILVGVGLLIGLLIGRWWAFLFAIPPGVLGLYAWNDVLETTGSQWGLGLVVALITAAGIGLGVLARWGRRTGS
jgi:hypothetical protein